MNLKFRVWMPLAAVLIVLLSVATLLLYVLPASKSRLGGYVADRTFARAAAAANAVAGAATADIQRELDLAAETGGGEMLIVDRRGRVVAQAGEDVLSPPEEILRSAADGERLNEVIGGQRVAVAPLIRGGNLDGGLVFAPGEAEDVVYQLIVRSGIEAAVVASILGGGLALFLATLLGRRVERIALGARAMGSGDLSSRIEPGSSDELGELAGTLNFMAERLEDSFSRLKESGATLNAILDNLSEGVLATDPEGRVVFANSVAQRMLDLRGGKDPSGEMPNPWKDFDLQRAVAGCIKNGRCLEARVRDGETFLHVKLDRLPRFEEGKGGVLVVIRDLSEGRRLEANQQRFLANAAHELKTPITTVLGAAELLLTEEEDDPEVRQRFLNHIHGEASRMRRLSETLLRLARTGYDLEEPDLRVLDLDGVARQAAERMEPLADSGGLTLRVEGRGGRVRADHEWLEQALLVVLNNAVQHSERGSEVRVRVEPNTVTIEDDGAGIDEEDLEMVFERFYRGRRDPEKGSGAGGGSFGLGLPICKELVERMGGSISLHSEEGVGTKVEIELPEVGKSPERSTFEEGRE
ncbi:MAG: ATP-binding protein [Actinomycetota bacterium]|nr:ATP-binding protein [Actinomycetota bacterium]